MAEEIPDNDEWPFDVVKEEYVEGGNVQITFLQPPSHIKLPLLSEISYSQMVSVPPPNYLNLPPPPNNSDGPEFKTIVLSQEEHRKLYDLLGSPAELGIFENGTFYWQS